MPPKLSLWMTTMLKVKSKEKIRGGWGAPSVMSDIVDGPCVAHLRCGQGYLGNGNLDRAKVMCADIFSAISLSFQKEKEKRESLELYRVSVSGCVFFILRACQFRLASIWGLFSSRFT